jgi:D-alanine-D-alanine ligase
MDIEKCNLNYPLFIKPVSEGTGKGITEKSLVNSEPELKEMAQYLLKRFDQPALVEEYLPGREFTVGVIGSGDEAVAIGGMEIEFKENYQIFCKYIPMASEFAEECKTVALNVWKALGGVDAGRVDIKADRNGRVCFMEVNPLAGLHPVHSDLPILSNMIGIKYQALMEMIVNSAVKRHHLKI